METKAKPEKPDGNAAPHSEILGFAVRQVRVTQIETKSNGKEEEHKTTVRVSMLKGCPATLNISVSDYATVRKNI